MPGLGLPTGFAVPVLETGSPGPAGFATGFAVPVLETGRGGGKTGAGGLDFYGPAGYACREGFGEDFP